MGGVHMAITSAMEAVEVAPGGTLPEKIAQFVEMDFSLSEFPKGHLFVEREHLILFKADVQEHLLPGIYQNGVFAYVAAISPRMYVLDGKFQRIHPGSEEGKFAQAVSDPEMLIDIRFHFDAIQRLFCSAGDNLSPDKYIILPVTSKVSGI